MEFAFFTADATKIRFHRVTAFTTSLIIVSVACFIGTGTDVDLNLVIRFALTTRLNILCDIFAFYSGPPTQDI